MTTRPLPAILLTLTLACTHSESFPTGGYDVGPSSASSDVLLTFNTNQNYWPTLTEDGSAVLYQFIDVNLGAPGLRHRCMGALPVEGGTRFWQWCDTRASEVDSATSFSGFAMGRDGRLVYVETTTPRLFPFQTPTTALWLADPAAPFRRRMLVSLPVVVGDSTVNWIAALPWTGPDTVLGLGQQLLPEGTLASTIDSVFRGEILIRGTITGEGATLAAIPGTAGATGYSLAEGGASIVFTHVDSTSLMKVPVAGGTPTLISATPRQNVQLFGVSCRNSTCVTAVGPAALSALTGSQRPKGDGPFELRVVSLADGSASTVLTRAQVLSSPLLLPSGDVVAQVGAGNGRFGSIDAFQTLHLYKGLVP